MVSAVYILYWPDNYIDYPNSEILIHRRYNNHIPSNSHLLRSFDLTYKRLQLHERVPFLFIDGIGYTYITLPNDLMLLAVSNTNANAMLIVVFLQNFSQILYRYLIKPDNNIKLDKDTILDNINIIFELLDECVDFGIIQLTDYNLLKEYIKLEINVPKLSVDEDDDEDDEKHHSSKSNKSQSKSKKNASKEIKSTNGQTVKHHVMSHNDNYINSSILKTSSLAINWRPKGVFYIKNEIYIDIVEDCHFYYDLGTETIKRNEIFGTCSARCYLSGMPVCQLGFNEENISGIDKADINPKKRDENNLLKFDENDEEDEEETSLADDLENDDTPHKLHSRIPIRNVQFHQCVELSSIYNDSLVKFVPPDDSFILMTYNVEQQKQRKKLPLIMIKPTFRIVQQNKLQILCILTTNFKRRLHCRDLLIKIPINPNIFQIDQTFNTDNLKYKSEMGDVSFKIDTSELFWKFDEINGRKTIKMMAEIQLNGSTEITPDLIDKFMFNRFDKPLEEVSDEDEDEDDSLDRFYGVNGKTGSLINSILRHAKSKQHYNNILVTFQIPLLAYSGIKVNYLTVEEEQLKYTCFPWVKYLTRAPTSQQQDNQNCYYRFKLGTNCFQIQN